jgi:hypothetical protein
METKSCIYCGRTLDVKLLIDKAGKYRCKDEYNCLDYQTQEDPADSIENPDYVSGIVKSSLTAAAERIAGYKGTKDDQTTKGSRDHLESAEESVAEWAWMKSVADALASEYQNNKKFVFQSDEAKNHPYRISFNDAAQCLYFTVKIEQRNGAHFALTVAREEGVADADPLYKEFVYKSYPVGRREDLLEDLAVVLLIFNEEKDAIPALLREFRGDIEARCAHGDPERRG